MFSNPAVNLIHPKGLFIQTIMYEKTQVSMFETSLPLSCLQKKTRGPGLQIHQIKMKKNS